MSNRLVAFFSLTFFLIAGGIYLYTSFVTQAINLELSLRPQETRIRADIYLGDAPLTTQYCQASCIIRYPRKSQLTLQLSAPGFIEHRESLSQFPTAKEITLMQEVQGITTSDNTDLLTALPDDKLLIERGGDTITFPSDGIKLLKRGDSKSSIVLDGGSEVPIPIAFEDILFARIDRTQGDIIHLITKSGLVKIHNQENQGWTINSPHPLYRDQIKYRDGMVHLETKPGQSLIVYQTPRDSVVLVDTKKNIIAIKYIKDYIVMLNEDGKWEYISLSIIP